MSRVRQVLISTKSLAKILAPTAWDELYARFRYEFPSIVCHKN